jgi:hypothetical protein
MIPRPQAKLAHTCDAKDVSDAKFVLDIQSKKEQIHVGLTNMLLQTVLRIITWSGPRTISLKAEELVPTSYLSRLEYTESAKALKDTHQKETGHSKGFLFIVTKIMTD